MPKDFYSNNHSIKVGVPNSGSGDFSVAAEGSIDITGDEVSISGVSASLIVSNNIEINKSLNITAGGADITGNVEISGNLTVGGSIDLEGISRAGNISFETTDGGDITLDATGLTGPLGSANINISAESNINIDSGNDLNIEADDDITISAGVASSNGKIELSFSSNAAKPLLKLEEFGTKTTLTSDTLEISGDTATINYSTTEVTSDTLEATADNITLYSSNVIIEGDSASSFILGVRNNANNSNADLVDLHLVNKVTPGGDNNWIRFRADGVSKGAIQGAELSTGYYIVYTNSVSGPNNFAVRDDSSALIGSNGDVQYASGNQDFGEWIEIGDLNEWGIKKEEIPLVTKGGILLLEEGLVVKVRGGKCWRSGNGTSMVITHRAAMVGSQKFDDDRIGVILSFIGQVPVLVEGVVSDGDYLVPVEGKNHCIGIPKNSITFEGYRAAIGTAWEDKTSNELSKVMCAINIK